ncbi:MAG: hypothetical protein LQ340_006978 [Diploschistes diacapsis]|nr:MAG: hypothetical protein LQ340_006978 [Diploschistes diacapsis]
MAVEEGQSNGVVPVSNGSSSNDNIIHGNGSYHYFSKPLAGKVALVTGGGRGIGAGIARELAIKGCSGIIINYASSSKSAAAVVADLESLGTSATAIRADLTKYKEVDQLFEQAVAKYGRLDIVASNSGKEMFRPLLETTEEDFDGIFNLNTRAQFFVAKAALKHISPHGRVILMSSIAAGLGVAGHALYAGSKNAVEGFTRCFAKDFGVKKCTVNCIAPAGVKSDMWTQNAWRYAPGCNKSSTPAEIEASLAAGSPLNRVAVPGDIGRCVAFLASEEGEWVNGQYIEPLHLTL